MEKRTKRVRGSNWNHEQTVALAELKREAFLNEEHGPLVWDRIAQILSSRFPGQFRTGVQCRRRWETLVKVYDHIEDYCVITGAQSHLELDEGELASMKLDSAYHKDWYDIVEQVCSQRNRKERCYRDKVFANRSKGSSAGSHSVELAEYPIHRYPLCPASTSQSVTHYEHSNPESTNTYAQVPCSPSLESKLGPEEEFLSFMNGNDASMLEATQLWQHGQVSPEFSQESQILESANQLPFTLPVDYAAQQCNWWDLIEIAPFETSILVDILFTDGGIEGRTTIDGALRSVPWNQSSSKSPQKQETSVWTDNNASWCASIMGNRARDESYEPETESSPNRTAAPAWHLNNGQPYSLLYDVPDSRKHGGARPLIPPDYEWYRRAHEWPAGDLGFDPAPSNNLPSADIQSSSDSKNQDGLSLAATRTSSSSSRSSDSTIFRHGRRWSVKMILLNILQCCYTCGRK